MKISKEMAIIFAIQTTEVLGFSLILPFLPLYAQKLGANPLEIGLIFAVFSFFQLLSQPIMGKLSDKYGRKPLLIISQVSTFISFLVLANAKVLWMIYLSRIIDGLLGSNATIAQAYISDISEKKDRSKAFGISTAAFGFGFLIGPVIGGYLSQISFGLPAYLAAGVTFITILATFIFLPETITKKSKEKIKFSIIETEDFKKYFRIPELRIRFIQYATFMVAYLVWTTNLALYASKKIGLGASRIGYTLAYIGFVSIIFRGVALAKLINKYGEYKLKLLGTGMIVVGLVFSVFVTNWPMFLIMMTVFAFGIGLFHPIIKGDISRKSPSDEQGAVLGVTNSIGSTAQVIAPLIGGFILSNFDPRWLGIITAIMMTISINRILKEREYDHPTTFFNKIKSKVLK